METLRELPQAKPIVQTLIPLMKFYSSEIEIQMQRYYQSLYEKYCRRYAAIETVKLGYGGLSYISRLFGFHYETLAHYPLYLSKYNPIEHRLFPHVTRACQGVILHSVQLLRDLISTTTTRTGLKVFTTIIDQPYQTGRKVAENFKSMMKIVFDPQLPQWKDLIGILLPEFLTPFPNRSHTSPRSPDTALFSQCRDSSKERCDRVRHNG